MVSSDLLLICSTKTSMKIEDIVSTLDTMGLLKVWKSQYVAAISEEVGDFAFVHP